MPAMNFFVNLKRFDVPRALGGLCPADNPTVWIDDVMRECVSLGIGSVPGASTVFLLPESLLDSAITTLTALPAAGRAGIGIGCQGVFRRDVAPGGNFGAFTSLRTAKAMKALGCGWAMVGHSEERRALLEIMGEYDPSLNGDAQKSAAAAAAVDRILNESALRAREAGLNVLFCLGETSEEQGSGSRESQLANAETVIRRQVRDGVKGITDGLALGYEPVWAIGPGRPTPDGDYMRFALDTARDEAAKTTGGKVPAVYGGGLKTENAAIVAGAGSDGGLIALTRFSGDIGFYPGELREIIDAYAKAARG